MQDFLAIVVPFQKQINGGPSTFPKSVEKMRVLAGFQLFFEVVLHRISREATEKISHFREIAT
jgi:hypothetical protein